MRGLVLYISKHAAHSLIRPVPPPPPARRGSLESKGLPLLGQPPARSRYCAFTLAGHVAPTVTPSLPNAPLLVISQHLDEHASDNWTRLKAGLLRVGRPVPVGKGNPRRRLLQEAADWLDKGCEIFPGLGQRGSPDDPI